MPIYEYKCDACDHECEYRQSMSDYKPKKKCPKCKKNKLFRLFSFALSVKTGINDIKTLGHLAARNRDNMSQDQLAEVEAKNPVTQRRKKKLANAPWWRPNTTRPDMSLTKMTKKQLKKYVKEGIKP